MTESFLRALAASLTVFIYALLCLMIWSRQRGVHRAAARAAASLAGDGADQSKPLLVLFASQTGRAEAIAWQTGCAIHGQGTPCRVIALNAVDLQTLQSARQAIFIASTYGEGDAPDNASLFTEQLIERSDAVPDLRNLRYEILALGDRQYKQFCGFARSLEDWLTTTGAVATAPRIEVDNGDPAALAQWRHRWGLDAGVNGDGERKTPTLWKLVSRELLNAGSSGGPVYRVCLRAPAGEVAHWESGDLVRVVLTSDTSRPRDYSIASIAAEGELQLLVRQECHPDGRLGAVSGLLTSTLAVGESVELHLRPHTNFRLGKNARSPIIFIGNGTGLAGLRSHLSARAAAGQHANWLLFGERNAAYDRLCEADVDGWHRSGVLQRLDLVFSRDQAGRVYVQHRLLQFADEVRTWLAHGAAIYVCGSLQGMAGGVDSALREIAGDNAVRELIANGRYRRDVY